MPLTCIGTSSGPGRVFFYGSPRRFQPICLRGLRTDRRLFPTRSNSYLGRCIDASAEVVLRASLLTNPKRCCSRYVTFDAGLTSCAQSAYVSLSSYDLQIDGKGRTRRQRKRCMRTTLQASGWCEHSNEILDDVVSKMRKM